jgi:hypothetical protein
MERKNEKKNKKKKKRKNKIERERSLIASSHKWAP